MIILSLDQETLQVLAGKIKVCDQNQPYYYVSYSTRDGHYVYKIVKALQEMGISLWIDVPQNFNSGGGYNSSIFSALSQANCQGILFFMSEHSMTSAQSAKELAYVKSETVIKSHGKALPIIAVEMNEIEHHDVERWVHGRLYQRYGNELLSTAEQERIRKYCEKYNHKLKEVQSKYDLAAEIAKYIIQFESHRIEYQEILPIEAYLSVLGKGNS